MVAYRRAARKRVARQLLPSRDMTTPIVLLTLGCLLAACGSRPTATATTTPTRSTGAADDAETRSASTATPVATTTPGCALEPVYFEYDSNTLDRRARDTLASGVACLRERPDASLTLVGGADERGTEEYNLSLGDRRARAVHGYLTGSGVEPTRLRVHTVGEEWSSGIDDASMARDRRVEPRSVGR